MLADHFKLSSYNSLYLKCTRARENVIFTAYFKGSTSVHWCNKIWSFYWIHLFSTLYVCALIKNKQSVYRAIGD